MSESCAGAPVVGFFGSYLGCLKVSQVHTRQETEYVGND